MTLTPDETIYWQWGLIKINATLVSTWIVMLILAVGSWLMTRRLSPEIRLTRGQNLLEILIGAIQQQIHEVTQQPPGRYLPFVGTLFLFILTCNSLTIVPGFPAPTGSLSTSAALAVCVFVAVPFYGISTRGLASYLKDYIQPNPVMLPFNILGELTRTVALAIRLFGNVMSGSMIGATMLAIAPLLFPIVMNALGLLLGVIQAYIFAILALVFIASATRAHEDQRSDGELTLNTEKTHG